jgi:hypothetical protein
MVQHLGWLISVDPNLLTIEQILKPHFVASVRHIAPELTDNGEDREDPDKARKVLDLTKETDIFTFVMVVLEINNLHCDLRLYHTPGPLHCDFA